MMHGMEVVPTKAVLGAEIRGVDLSRELDDATFRQIENAFDRHGVIYFRDQQITPDQQIAFARRFGEVEININTQVALPGYPELMMLSNIRENGRYIGMADAGITWHTDMSATRTPPRCSILYSREVPHDAAGKPLGGTVFASAMAAYAALPAELKTRLAGKRATHSYYSKMMARKRAVGLTREITQEHLDRTPAVQHPVFRTHPVTRQLCIYVTPGECTGIDGLPEAEATALIEELHRHLIDARFQYTHHWRVGDVLMWDNCTCQHLGVRDYSPDQRRLMHRVTVNGSAPF